MLKHPFPQFLLVKSSISPVFSVNKNAPSPSNFYRGRRGTKVIALQGPSTEAFMEGYG